jgi:predicted transcriptional regulator
MKILQAIVDSDGAAGFTEIKYATDLSTGSIYYHLGRMVRYVIKKSKQYYITKEGLELLQEHNGTSAMK